MQAMPGQYSIEARCKNCHATHILAFLPSVEEFPQVPKLVREISCSCGLTALYTAEEIRRQPVREAALAPNP
jgi:hypothetical protein